MHRHVYLCRVHFHWQATLAAFRLCSSPLIALVTATPLMVTLSVSGAQRLGHGLVQRRGTVQFVRAVVAVCCTQTTVLLCSTQLS